MRCVFTAFSARYRTAHDGLLLLLLLIVSSAFFLACSEEGPQRSAKGFSDLQSNEYLAYHRYEGTNLSLRDFVLSLNYRLDDVGLPLVYRKEVRDYVRHPVVAGSILLQFVGRESMLLDQAIEALQMVDTMITHGSKDGVLLYPFPYTAGLYRYRIEKNWGSAMAQGYFLSVLGKLYSYFTSVDRMDLALQAKELGMRVLDPFKKHLLDGGIFIRLCDKIACSKWFPEYPSNPPVYTLNGFLFALIGLYDFHMVTGDPEAESLFWEGYVSLRRAVFRYDGPVLSSYDLAHITWSSSSVSPNLSPKYNAIHARQLNWIGNVTRDLGLICIATVWALKGYYDQIERDVDDDVWKQCGQHFDFEEMISGVPYDDRLRAALVR